MLGKRYNYKCFKYVRDYKIENQIQFQVEDDDLSKLIHQLEVILFEKLRGLEEIPFNSDIHPYINVYMQIIIELLASAEKANQEAGRESIRRLEKKGIETRVLYFILYEALFRVQIMQRTLSEEDKLSFLQAIFETKDRLEHFVSQYIKYYQYLGYDYFAQYEECIQDLCVFAGRIYKIGPEININKEKVFTRTLYRAISFSGDKGDLGYAYDGLTILKAYINQIPNDLLIIQLLNHYDDRFLTSDRMAQKQIKAITRGYYFSVDKAKNLLITEQIEAFYLNRRYIEYYINQTLINHQYSQAKGSYLVDEEVATLEIIGGGVNNIMQTRLEKRLATIRDGNEQIHAEIISKYEGFKNVKIQLLTKEKKDNPDQTISLVIEKEQVIIKNEKEVIAYFNPKTFFIDTETKQKVLESLNKNIAQIFDQKGQKQVCQEGEVLYLWINQYKGITIPQEINLSGQYHFAYNKVSGVLEVESKDVPKVKNFYNVLGPKEQSKLHVLNGIIGKNGTGKTTLVDFIKNKLNKDAQGEYDFILAYKKNNKVACFYNFKGKDQPFRLVTEDEAVYVARENEMPGWLDQTNIIYFSNIMNLNQRMQSTLNNERGHNLIDISTSSLYEKEVNGPEKYFYSYDIARQTLFLLDYVDKKIPLNLEEKDFKVPEYFVVGIHHKVERDGNKSSEKERYDKILEDVRKEIQIKSLRDKFDYNISQGSEGYIKFKLLFQEEGVEIRQLIKLYFQQKLPEEIFFELTPLSSGQTARLILYSRFYWITRQAEEYKEWGIEDYLVGEEFSLAKHVIILVDEGETFFHPEWQRRYIYDLIYFLQVIFKDYEATESIQLIITSNSPLVISDLLDGNIAFLGEMTVDKMEKEENKTFAQNIYLLFRDTFFMERGVTGEFARIKINQLVKEIQNEGKERDEMREKEIDFIIESIGEPLIKQKLLALFNEKRSKESQLAYYERKIQQLKTQLNQE